MQDSFLKIKKKRKKSQTKINVRKEVNTQKIYRLKFMTTLLKAYSQAYILITLIPAITSFMTRIRISVSLADFNLDTHTGMVQVIASNLVHMKLTYSLTTQSIPQKNSS